jgi:hypothetical protein
MARRDSAAPDLDDEDVSEEDLAAGDARLRAMTPEERGRWLLSQIPAEHHHELSQIDGDIELTPEQLKRWVETGYAPWDESSD